jgi:hypothetical protein
MIRMKSEAQWPFKVWSEMAPMNFPGRKIDVIPPVPPRPSGIGRRQPA